MLEEGAFGRRLRIFFHEFYGEGFELKGGAVWERAADERPFACIVWSGRGTANGTAVAVDATREFLVTPGTPLQLTNSDAEHDLLVYSVFPILAAAE